MCRNRNKITILTAVFLLAAVSLSACGFSEKFITDVGTESKQVIQKEDYLKTDISLEEEQTAESHYQVYTLRNGIYEEKIRKQSLAKWEGGMSQVRYSLEGIPACFGGYVAEFLQYVEPGDVIATAYTEVDEFTILEAQIKLNRLQERYRDAETQLNQDLADIEEEMALIYNDYKKNMMQIRYQQRQQDFELTKYHFENQIKEAQDEVERLSVAGDVYEIKSDKAGYVYYDGQYPAGQELKEGDTICHIIPTDAVYQATDEQAEEFVYGMEEDLVFKFGEVKAKVVSGGGQALYGNLDTGSTVFRLDIAKDLPQTAYTDFNGTSKLKDGTVKRVKNVVLVPKQAVTEEKGEYFVTVLKEDGGLLKTEFIPGGSNAEVYWVLEGLSDGMKIVYN